MRFRLVISLLTLQLLIAVLIPVAYAPLTDSLLQPAAPATDDLLQALHELTNTDDIQREIQQSWPRSPSDARQSDAVPPGWTSSLKSLLGYSGGTERAQFDLKTSFSLYNELKNLEARQAELSNSREHGQYPKGLLDRRIKEISERIEVAEQHLHTHANHWKLLRADQRVHLLQTFKANWKSRITEYEDLKHQIGELNVERDLIENDLFQVERFEKQYLLTDQEKLRYLDRLEPIIKKRRLLEDKLQSLVPDAPLSHLNTPYLIRKAIDILRGLQASTQPNVADARFFQSYLWAVKQFTRLGAELNSLNELHAYAETQPELAGLLGLIKDMIENDLVLTQQMKELLDSVGQKYVKPLINVESSA